MIFFSNKFDFLHYYSKLFWVSIYFYFFEAYQKLTHFNLNPLSWKYSTDLHVIHPLKFDKMLVAVLIYFFATNVHVYSHVYQFAFNIKHTHIYNVNLVCFTIFSMILHVYLILTWQLSLYVYRKARLLSSLQRQEVIVKLWQNYWRLMLELILQTK